MVCSFFGHHDAPTEMKPELIALLQSIIEHNDSIIFLVGNQGSFDRIVLSALRTLKAQHPQITYYVVLAYLPGKETSNPYYTPGETMYPEGLEKVPRKFAISHRNDWMLKQSDMIICYVKHFFGGSGKMLEKAIRQKKRIINLSPSCQALPIEQE